MNTEQKNEIIKILIAQKSDDLHRVESAFRNLSPKEMGQEWGGSGKTPFDILIKYREHEKRINDLVRAVQEINTL